MSAFTDIPSDLLDWAARTGRDVDPQGFLPRMEYAAYLQDCLAAVADHRLTVRAGQVDDVVPTPRATSCTPPASSARPTLSCSPTATSVRGR